MRSPSGAARSALAVVALALVLAAQPAAAAAIRNLPGFTEVSLGRIDDSPSALASVGFPLNVDGQFFTSVFVNNNGNVTLNSALAAFTPFDLTTTNRHIIAPFFADVDTRSTGSAVVTYGTDVVGGRPAFGVNWVGVGYFDQHVDKLNHFQLVLIDRSDISPGDYDIEFNYDQIEWETGDASGGVGGLGGFSARAGYAVGTPPDQSFFELPGSGVNGGLLDSNTTTGLIHNQLNSSTPGRYVFASRGGIIQPVTLTVTRTGPGTISSTPSGIDCGTDCTQVYPRGQVVNLTAAAAQGSFVVAIGGDPDCVDLILTLDADTTCTVTFSSSPPPPPVLVSGQVSVGIGGETANGPSEQPKVSGDGSTVVFRSRATNLASPCTTGPHEQVFARDRTTGLTSCVSVTSDPGGSGAPGPGLRAAGNGPSGAPAVNVDGRFVAFESTARNLAAPCTTGIQQVFVHDRMTGSTTCASLAGAAVPGNGPSGAPALSADGRLLAFQSRAMNLAPGCSSGTQQVFVRDLATGSTTCASVTGGGSGGNAASGAPAMSANGQVLTFQSLATNLAGAGPCNDVGIQQVFVLNRGTNQMGCASVVGGSAGNQSAAAPSLSADGQMMAFQALATNLDAPCTAVPAVQHVFVVNRTTGGLECVTVGPGGGAANGPSRDPVLSGNGRLVVFSSSATNLTGDPASGTQVYMADLVTGVVTLVSQTIGSLTGAPRVAGNGDSELPSVGDNGNPIVFESSSSNLAQNDDNGVQDVFEMGQPPPLPTGRVVLVAPASGSRFSVRSGVSTLLTFAWTGLPNATGFAFEFTGRNLAFQGAPNTGPDPVNGFGGAGGACVTGNAGFPLPPGVGPCPPGSLTQFTVTLDSTFPVGQYQVRVLGLPPNLTMFSDPVTVTIYRGSDVPVPPDQVVITSPPSGTVLTRGLPVTFAWTALAGAVSYFVEFTPSGLSFTNPNGTGVDPVNGAGGLGGGGSVGQQTNFTPLIPLDPAALPAGTYQLRVLPLTAAGQAAGRASDAVTVVIP